MKRIEERLEALEAKHGGGESVRHIFIMPAGVDDGAIQGFQHGEHVIRRQAGESLESLEARAVEAIQGTGVAIIAALRE